jgi:G:T-mismatch repair DNA endonuclease (very short patch repair protein)
MKKYNLIIEIFGDYWHNLPKYKKLDKERLKTYSKDGYKTLIIWEHELKKDPNVSNKIMAFIGI